MTTDTVTVLHAENTPDFICHYIADKCKPVTVSDSGQATYAVPNAFSALIDLHIANEYLILETTNDQEIQDLTSNNNQIYDFCKSITDLEKEHLCSLFTC